MAGWLRILTANLWNGRADPEGFAALLEREGVDVACLQELTPEQAGAIASVLPHGALEPARDYTGMGIALRRHAEVTSLPLRYRPLRATRLDPKDWAEIGRPLAIWNVHVRAPHSLPLHVSWSIRRAQLRALLGHLERAETASLLLLGDLNATPLWPVYRRLASRLDDLALRCARRDGQRPAATWGPWASPRVRWLRIDHALGRGAQVRQARVLPVPGSDHDALCVDVRLG